MKIIIGLGNPGPEYEKTRHNLGFEVVNRQAEKSGAKWVDKPKFHSRVAETTIDGEKTLFVKPQTFYNLTGQAARTIRDYYKLTNADILVIHDEMDLPVGTFRTRIGGSDAGNKGVKSLNEHLGTDFARLRIGSGNDHATENRVGHVLSAPNNDEMKKIAALGDEIDLIIRDFISGKFTKTSIRK